MDSLILSGWRVSGEVFFVCRFGTVAKNRSPSRGTLADHLFPFSRGGC